MANKFLVTNIVDPVKAPITEAGLRHINSMPQVVGEALVKGLIGSYTTNDIIILQGCVVAVLSGAVPGSGTASLSAGFVYRNGEIFAVDANALLTTTANTLVWVADDELLDSAQTKFSDGSDYDFLRVAKLKLQAGTSGSGLADFDASTVKNIRRTQNIASGVNADIFGKALTISFLTNPPAFTAGTTVFTIPAALRTLVNKGLNISCSTYTGGGGAAQQNKSTILAVNTLTGVCTLGLDMDGDVIVGQFTYYLD
jgi:hypothetical protein